MKTLLALLLLITPLRAIDLVYEWDAAPADFEVIGYNFYEVTSASETVKLGTTAEPTFTVSNVAPGKHWYFVTLVNLWGESVTYADDMTPPVFPSPMDTKKLRRRTVTIQGSMDMQKWEDVQLVAVPEMPGNRTFYRMIF